MAIFYHLENSTIVMYVLLFFSIAYLVVLYKSQTQPLNRWHLKPKSTLSSNNVTTIYTHSSSCQSTWCYKLENFTNVVKAIARILPMLLVPYNNSTRTRLHVPPILFQICISCSLNVIFKLVFSRVAYVCSLFMSQQFSPYVFPPLMLKSLIFQIMILDFVFIHPVIILLCISSPFSWLTWNSSLLSSLYPFWPRVSWIAILAVYKTKESPTDYGSPQKTPNALY